MSGRIKRSYKPKELMDAQRAVLATGIASLDPHEASRLLAELYKLGYRLVYVGKAEQ